MKYRKLAEARCLRTCPVAETEAVLPCGHEELVCRVCLEDGCLPRCEACEGRFRGLVMAGRRERTTIVAVSHDFSAYAEGIRRMREGAPGGTVYIPEQARHSYLWGWRNASGRKFTADELAVLFSINPATDHVQREWVPLLNPNVRVYCDIEGLPPDLSPEEACRTEAHPATANLLGMWVKLCRVASDPELRKLAEHAH